VADPAATRTQARIAGIWLLSRVAVFVIAAVTVRQVLTGSSPVAGFIDSWNLWETPWYASIAQHGYPGPGDFVYNTAYFPGLALLMVAGSWVGLVPAATGLIVSFFAGLAAALALGRLTELVGGRAEYGVLAWVVAPTAVFLAAPWSEALFAGLAFWAWVLAKRQAWVLAGVIAGFAALTRINGLFLAVALVVLFLLHRPRNWARGTALLIPFAVVAGHFAYLHAATGSWTEWFDVQAEKWDRHLTDPVHAFLNTYNMIFTFSGTGAPSSRFVMEIAAAALLLALGVVILVMRWWAEAVYVLLTVASLVTSTFYYSIPRAAVLLFPVWMLLGLWMTRHRWFRIAYLCVAIPFLALVVVRFLQGQWIS